MSDKNPYKFNGDTLVIDDESKLSNTKSVYLESYGCAMNFSDSEIVASILSKNGYNTTENMFEADLILVNTCSIREKAELTVRKRLEKFNRFNSKILFIWLSPLKEYLFIKIWFSEILLMGLYPQDDSFVITIIAKIIFNNFI